MSAYGSFTGFFRVLSLPASWLIVGITARAVHFIGDSEESYGSTDSYSAVRGDRRSRTEGLEPLVFGTKKLYSSPTPTCGGQVFQVFKSKLFEQFNLFYAVHIANSHYHLVIPTLIYSTALTIVHFDGTSRLSPHIIIV